MTQTSSLPQTPFLPWYSRTRVTTLYEWPLHDSNPGKVFLGGLSYESNEDSIRSHFEDKFGQAPGARACMLPQLDSWRRYARCSQVSDAHIVRDRLTGMSRGFGFVTFVDPAVARAVQMTDHTIDGDHTLSKPMPREGQTLGTMPYRSPVSLATGTSGQLRRE